MIKEEVTECYSEDNYDETPGHLKNFLTEAQIALVTSKTLIIIYDDKKALVRGRGSFERSK